MSTTIPAFKDLVSVNGASLWLRAQGFRPCTRMSVYTALAHNRLRAFGTVDRVTLIKRAELERYASTLQAALEAQRQA